MGGRKRNYQETFNAQGFMEFLRGSKTLNEWIFP